MKRTKQETIKPTFSFRRQFRHFGQINQPAAHPPDPAGLKVHIIGKIVFLTNKMFDLFYYNLRRMSSEKQLSDSLSKLSMSDKDRRSLGLSQDQVNILQDAAHLAKSIGVEAGGHHQHQDDGQHSSPMDRYMQMKSQQDLDSITCNH